MMILYIFAVMFGFWNIIVAVAKNNVLSLVKWFGWFILITDVLFLPKTTVLIKDPLTKYQRDVANVPYLLGSMASVISVVGHHLTIRMESLFGLPDDLQYHQTGSVFASKLFRQMGNFKIRDGILKGNISRFIQNCVVYDAMVGYQYNITDLQSSDDLLALISNTSNIVGFVYQSQGQVASQTKSSNNQGSTSKDKSGGTGSGNSRIVTCKEGIELIKSDLRNDVISVAGRLASKLGLTPDPNDKANAAVSNLLLTKLENSYKFLTNISKTGEDVLKQEMVINAIQDASKNKAEELGSPHNYAVSKAMIQQRSSASITAELASQSLASMKVVFEALAYAFFIFMPMALMLPNGLQVLSNYFGMLISIQLWAPLYAVLNLLMTLTAKYKSGGVMGAEGLTMLTSVGFANLHSGIETAAGFLSITIPGIAYKLVQFGSGSLSQFAANITGSYQSAAAGTGAELASGNMSMGNVSYATSSLQTFNGFKYDSNISHHSGRMEMASEDGSIAFATATGAQGFKAGAGINSSAWDHQLNLQSNLSSVASRAIQDEQSKMASLSHEYNTAESNALRQATNLLDRIHKSGARSQNWSIAGGTEDSTNLTNTISFMDELQKRHGYSSAQSAEIAAGVSIGASIGKTGANASTNFKSNADYHDAINKGKALADTMGITTSLNKTVRHGDQIGFTENEQVEKALARDLANSFDQMQGYRQAMQVSEQNIARLSAGKSYMESHGANLNQDLAQKLVEYIANQKVTISSDFSKPPQEIGYGTARKIIMAKGQDYYAYMQGFLENELQNIGAIAPSMSGGAKFDTLSNVAPRSNYQEAQGKIESEHQALKPAYKASAVDTEDKMARIKTKDSPELQQTRINMDFNNFDALKEYKPGVKGQKTFESSIKGQEAPFNKALSDRKHKMAEEGGKISSEYKLNTKQDKLFKAVVNLVKEEAE